MNKYGDSVSSWRTTEVVLNHSVGHSSVETQAEVSLYIWVISLIRQIDTLYWLRITGIFDLWRVSNSFRKSTKTSDAVTFVTLQVSITHLSAINSSVVDLPAMVLVVLRNILELLCIHETDTRQDITSVLLRFDRNQQSYDIV